MKIRNMIRWALFAALIGAGLAPSAVWADAKADAVETGRLLAILLDAGRATVGANQTLINDASKGDKGFTPEVFEKQLTDKFKERTGIDLADLKNAKVPAMTKLMLPQLVGVQKKVVADYQPIINRPGVGFKGFIPATFGTQTTTRYTAKTGNYLKQTAADKILRNPRNKADEFEAAMLAKFADPAYPRQGEKIVSEVVDGGKAVRVMLPLFYGKGCLGCHGEPAGERDITGYKRDGYKEGDNGGAISVKLLLK
jgi:general secretion pathway protein A